MNTEIFKSIKSLADKYALDLQKQVDLRMDEMKNDDNSHYLIYRVLGISDHEGNLIDLYQNKGRFLYNTQVRFLKKLQLCV